MGTGGKAGRRVREMESEREMGTNDRKEELRRWTTVQNLQSGTADGHWFTEANCLL